MMLVCDPHRHHNVAHRFRRRHRSSSPFAILEDDLIFGGAPFALPRRRPASLLDSFHEALVRDAELDFVQEAFEGMRLAKRRRRHLHDLVRMQQLQYQLQQQQQHNQKDSTEQTIPIATDEKHQENASEKDQTKPEKRVCLFDSAVQHGFSGLFNTLERDEAGNAHVVVPLNGGVKAEDVKLRIDGNRVLTIEGRSEHKDEARGSVRSFHFTRSVALPGDLDLEHVTATVNAEAGHLSIALPKLALPAAPEKVREIEIQTTAAEPSAPRAEKKPEAKGLQEASTEAKVEGDETTEESQRAEQPEEKASEAAAPVAFAPVVAVPVAAAATAAATNEKPEGSKAEKDEGDES